MSQRASSTGVDLGGTKIEAAVLSAGGQVLARKRCPTPQGDYEGTLAAVANLVHTVEEAADAQAPHVGIGAPGSVDPATGLHRNANSTVLNGRPLQDDLTAAIGRPIKLANDADCLALSEAHDGSGAGHRCVFALILGTGVGGGLVIDGELHTGANGLGGEFGHTALPRLQSDELRDVRCWCGMLHCLEAWLAGPVLERQWLDLGNDSMRASDIAARARSRSDASSAQAAAVIERWLDRLARALGGLVTVLDPDVIVIGGGLSCIEALYDDLPERIGRYTFNGACTTPIHKATHGDSSGVLGAARLRPRQLSN
ncbi:MAG: ROK family protein [Phycisphaerales bacterium]|nr:ROK family protein [Phycisphaerales bacterium]